VARVLELGKLAGMTVAYTPSRNRQWHMYACGDREPRAPALKRLFLRGQVGGWAEVGVCWARCGDASGSPPQWAVRRRWG
jgi:hypothetical protein